MIFYTRNNLKYSNNLIYISNSFLKLISKSIPKILLIKAYGIGPEIADAVVEIFDAAKIPSNGLKKT